MTNQCELLKRSLDKPKCEKKHKQLTNSNAYKRCVPNNLSKDDKCRQVISMIKSKKRPALKSFKSKQSKWTKLAKDYFKGDASLDDIAKT